MKCRVHPSRYMRVFLSASQGTVADAPLEQLPDRFLFAMLNALLGKAATVNISLALQDARDSSSALQSLRAPIDPAVVLNYLAAA